MDGVRVTPILAELANLYPIAEVIQKRPIADPKTTMRRCLRAMESARPISPALPTAINNVSRDSIENEPFPKRNF